MTPREQAAATLHQVLSELTESFNFARIIMDQPSRDVAGELVKDAREALRAYEAVDGWRIP